MDEALRKRLDEIRQGIEEAQQAAADRLAEVAPDYLKRVEALVGEGNRLPPNVESVLADYAAISKKMAEARVPKDVRFSLGGFPGPVDDGLRSNSEDLSLSDVEPSEAKEEGERELGAENYPNTSELEELVGNASTLSVLRDMHEVMVAEVEKAESKHAQLMRNEKIVRRQSWAILILTVFGTSLALWDRLVPQPIEQSLERIATAMEVANSGPSEAMPVANVSADPPEPASTPARAPADNAPSSSDQRAP